MPKAQVLRLVTRQVEEPHMSDEEIVARLGTRDRRAARQLYDRVYAPVDAALCRVNGTRGSDHEDLMQRTFELLFSTLVEGKFAFGCSLATWASAIAGRVALTALRSRRRERRVIDRRDVADDTSLTALDVERRVMARSELDRVVQLLASMKVEQAETLVLHDVLGHRLSEVAELTGTTVAAAQSRLVRGRKQFLERASRGGGR